MRYIIFGGAFDPIHMDHLSKCKQVLDITGYDRLLLMPTYKHVWGKKTAILSHRVAMLLKALADFKDPRIRLDLFEIVHRIKGPTIDTLKMLFKRHYRGMTPNNTAYLVGIDQAILINLWDRWGQLVDLIPFIVISRGDYKINSIKKSGLAWFLEHPHQYVEVTGFQVSSSGIRQDIKKNKLNPEHLTPNTLTYIKEHELYV